MVVDWEQETGLLVSSGDVRIVRIWDTDREMKVQVTRLPGGPGRGLCAHSPRPPACRRPSRWCAGWAGRLCQAGFPLLKGPHPPWGSSPPCPD